jgi:hypothetical protein
MPIYEYGCYDCHKRECFFSALLRLERRAACPRGESTQTIGTKVVVRSESDGARDPAAELAG